MSAAMDIVKAALARVAERRRTPVSTYRVQFHAGFTFRDAVAIVPYLAELGITHLYASPYLMAAAGSTHGYDVIDHSRLNPELGTEADYDALVAALQQHGMSHILDSVPNHVGIATNHNAWWNDVLEYGRESRYGRFFDIAWEESPRPQLHGKVLLPVLGEPYGDVLEKGELKLSFEDGAFAVNCYDRRFPISPRTYGLILRGTGLGPVASGHRLEACATDNPELEALIDEFQRVSDAAEDRSLKARLASLASRDPSVADAIAETLRILNGFPGDPRNFDRLDELLNRQFYRLAYWRVAREEINYRRFFDINDLAALSMEREEVFAATHAFTLKLLAEGKVAGLRIDHPDGLYDPKQYLARLQQQYLVAVARETAGGPGVALDEAELAQSLSEAAAADSPRQPLYVAVEKILAADESLPSDWPVAGASGYDFINQVNGIFVHSANADEFTRIYCHWAGEPCAEFADLVYRKKRLILEIAFAGELQSLAHRLDCIAQQDRHTRDFTLIGLRQGLREMAACFPVYRSYVCGDDVREDDTRFISAAADAAMARNPGAAPAAVICFIRETLLKGVGSLSPARRAERLRFAGKFQQLTAPVTAKGIEDTAFYIFNRFVSSNEVGGDPGRFGQSPEGLHRYLAARQAKWPGSLSPLSTHDTKRSEDVRARLNVVSEIPREWEQAVTHWRRLNEPCRGTAGGCPAPDANDEYLIYQTLAGAAPLDSLASISSLDFVKRIQAYMQKAVREAKTHTNWTDPNTAYETSLREFISAILDEARSAAFLSSFRSFAARIVPGGVLNSLAQTLLRLTAPGVPDTYQGTELWDFSLVDPDNRRPVDYRRRARLLRDLKHRVEGPEASRRTLLKELAANLSDDRTKLFVTWQGLSLRRERPSLFDQGAYIAAKVSGDRRDHVFAFARRLGNECVVVAVPRLMAGAPDRFEWGDTRLELPGIDAATPLRDLFSGAAASSESGAAVKLAAGAIFEHFPLALLMSF